MDLDTIFASVPQLETSRLILRGLRASDAEATFATYSDAETMEFYGRLPHQSLEESSELLQWIAERYEQRLSIRWGITLRGSDEVIGSCGLFLFDEEYRRATTGYELRRAYWRQGVMTEAMRALLGFGFDEMGLHRIEAVVDDVNERSKGLLRKLGFSFEGTLRQRFWFRGRYLDEHYFGLLRDEWRG